MAKPDFETLVARYKGYSSEGLTLEEVLAKLETTEHEIAKLERALEQLADEE